MLVVASKGFSEYTLTHLLPFLIVKHEKAHEALDFLTGLRAGSLRRQLTPQERDIIRSEYLAGATFAVLMEHHKVGHRAIRSALPNEDLRHRRKLPNECPQCGRTKRWRRSNRDGLIAICRACETERRHKLAYSPGQREKGRQDGITDGPNRGGHHRGYPHLPGEQWEAG